MRYEITREEIESIYKEGVEAVIELVLRLLSIIRELEEEIQRLKEILSKDSHNSHKPPSSDGFKKRKRNLRERSGNKPGGKEGHKGETLRMRDEADRIVSHCVEVCSFCGSCLKWVESLNLAEKKGEIRVIDDQILSPTYTADLARKVKELIFAHQENPSGNCGLYHIANRGQCFWYGFAQKARIFCVEKSSTTRAR